MMMNLLVLKEKCKQIYGKYDKYIVPAFKFIFAFLTFTVINANVGFMAKLKSPLVSLLLSVVCAFLPSGAVVAFAALIILGHIAASSLELALVVFVVFFVLLCAYFRFAPKGAYMAVLTPVLFALKVPYLAPFIAGLTMNVFSFIPVAIGVFSYYLLKFASGYDQKLGEMTTTSIMENVNYIMDGLFNNKAMLVYMLVFSVSAIIIYIVRKMALDYAWLIASVVGALVNLVLMIIGKFALGADINIFGIIIGNIFGLVIAFFLYVLVFSGDYTRTENVQFEDDDYYYYVKAVPKVSVSTKDVRVKKINAHKARRTAASPAVRDDRKNKDYDDYQESYENEEDSSEEFIDL